MGEARHVHFRPGADLGDIRLHVLRDAGRGVQREGGPQRVDIALGDAVAAQELCRVIGAVHFDALALAAARHQAYVVEHRAGVEQPGIQLQCPGSLTWVPGGSRAGAFLQELRNRV